MLPDFLTKTIVPELKGLGYKIQDKDCSDLLGKVNIKKGNICISIDYNIHPHDYPSNDVSLSIKNIKKSSWFRPKKEERLFYEIFDYHNDGDIEKLLTKNIKRTLNIDI